MEYGFSIGSNLDDRLASVRAARAALADCVEPGTLEFSALYETEPVDVAPEHRGLPFLNAVLIAQSERDPFSMLADCQRIEARLGRERKGRNSPRTIDIDIIYAGGELIDSPELRLPHPRWSARRFVLAPLAELRPRMLLPGTAHTVANLLDGLPGNARIQLFKSDW